MGTSAHDANHIQQQQSLPSVCPLCGGTVVLAQCGWMRAMPVCQNAQCLYPMVSELPALCLPRPYTDMPTSPSDAASSASPAKAATADAPAEEATTGLRYLPIEPEEVFIHCLTDANRASALSAAALTAVLCGPVQRLGASGKSPLASCLRAYNKALRLARASLQPSLQSSEPRATPLGRRFRNLEMDAQVEGLALRELEAVERLVAKPLSISVTDPRDDFYDTLRRLIKADTRLAKRFESVLTLRQVCTECFGQHASRQKATVLRLSDPASDFNLYDPVKRVILRPCHHCQAPQQRVLLRWEKPSDSRQVISDGIFLEARDGLAGVTQLQSLRTDAAVLMPTAAVQRVARSDNHFYYVVWLYSRDTARWMRLGPNLSGESTPPLACHDAAAAPTFKAGELVAALFERDEVPAAVFALGGADGTEPSSSFTCDGSGRSSAVVAPTLSKPADAPSSAAALSVAAQPVASPAVEEGGVASVDDDWSILAELFGEPAPPPPPPPPAPPAASGSRPRVKSLHHRLKSVMAQRRAGSASSSSASASVAASVHSEPIGGSPAAVLHAAANASGRGFVMSRFLSSAGQAERRLPAYSEDRHLVSNCAEPQAVVEAAAPAPAIVEPSLPVDAEPQLKRARTVADGRMSLLELAKSTL